MRYIGKYHVEDPTKIQGRDEVRPGERSLAALRLEHALAALAGIHGQLLLLGCGAGRYLRAIARARPDLTLHGADLSRSALREAQWRAPRHHLVCLDASLLPYRDGAFDAVLFFDLLEHVPEHRRMLAEVARVLRPGGVLHAFVPLEGKRDTVYHLLGTSRWLPLNRWKRDHVGHINHFTPEQVFHAVWEAGLVVERRSYGFHLASQIHDLVDYWQRERVSGGGGVLPLALVRLIARAVFIPTWRLSYLEDRLYHGRHLAAGLHLTARKPPAALAARPARPSRPSVR
ncbi:MAG: methyltransferase domain-containing protein [Sphaerobacter sp.]|nr:methyltransferase domain-containing protein [Sphaerobacter sp.]